MTSVIDILTTFGQFTLEQMWFPLLMWTIIAAPIALFMHWSDSLPPAYHYHGRVALLLVLPVGIAISYGLEALEQGMQTAVSASKILVFPNPISVSPVNTEPSLMQQLYDPMVWIGVVSLLVLIGAGYLLFKMASSYLLLRFAESRLDFKPLTQHPELLDRLSVPEDRAFSKTLLAFSPETSVPYTYGWRRTKIVIPSRMKADSEALAMAVQHELMHIKHRDYLLNNVLMAIRSLFWIHPLAHYLHKSGREYREILCDAKVLSNHHFSKKRYASLLFELAQQKPQSKLAMSMAVNPSSLKKRIQIMSEQTFSPTSLRSSLLVTFVSAALIVVTIGCSDMSDNGITTNEFQQAQSQISKKQSDAPLYIVNGEQLASDRATNNKISRIKSKYLKSVNVLKGQQAINKYGRRGKNGVIELTLAENIDKETVFSDLKDKVVEVSPDPDGKETYVAVKHMPELIGGLAGLQKMVTYPKKAAKAGIEGTVTLQFIVDKQGNVEDPQVLRGIGSGCDQEALQAVRKAQFKPGKDKNGNPVRVQYSLPIRFQLAKNSNKNS